MSTRARLLSPPEHPPTLARRAWSLMGAMLSSPLSLLSPPSCAGCDAPLDREAVFCARCAATLEPPPPLPPTMGASFAFGGAVADTLRRAKYQQRYDLVRPLRRLVIEGLDDPLALASVDAVVPVSSHRDRVRERGMDLPTLLAVAVARHLDRPLRTSLLERTRAIGPLAGRSLEERRREVAGVFEVRPATGIRTVLLVDDVVTTGATFADAARAFAAHRIDARLHAVAATPRHSPEPSPL